MTRLADAEDWEFAQSLWKYAPDLSEPLESIAGSLQSILEIYNVLHCDGARVLRLLLDDTRGYVIFGREMDGSPYTAFCTGSPDWQAAPALAEEHGTEDTPLNVRLFRLYDAVRAETRRQAEDDIPF